MGPEAAAGVSEAVHGLVMALQANYCSVALEGPGPGSIDQLLCTRRTRLAKRGQSICVGDRVRVEGIDWRAGRGAVAAVLPRSSQLERPAVANVSRIVVVVALAEPLPDPLQLSRFLITAEASGAPVLPVLSKADLLPAAAVADWCRRLQGWGYAPMAVATTTGQGLDGLRQQLEQPGIAVICGPSGVGKSSLLNALLPALDLRVAAVSGRLQRGRHTTRHVELFSLAPGALVADTPGFNRPRLPGDLAALGALFPEVRAALDRAGSCRFSNCLHEGEPGCAVGTAWDRWPLYRHCLDDLRQDLERAPAPSPDSAGLHCRGGRLEPRLPARYRRSSRRSQRQQEEREDRGPGQP